MAASIPHTTRHQPPLLRRLAIVLTLAVALLLGALSTTALAAPRSAPARPATRDAVVQDAAQQQSGPGRSAWLIPLLLGGIFIFAAAEAGPRYIVELR